jgi:hypothetical protein
VRRGRRLPACLLARAAAGPARRRSRVWRPRREGARSRAGPARLARFGPGGRAAAGDARTPEQEWYQEKGPLQGPARGPRAGAGAARMASAAAARKSKADKRGSVAEHDGSSAGDVGLFRRRSNSALRYLSGLAGKLSPGGSTSPRPGKEGSSGAASPASPRAGLGSPKLGKHYSWMGSKRAGGEVVQPAEELDDEPDARRQSQVLRRIQRRKQRRGELGRAESRAQSSANDDQRDSISVSSSVSSGSHLTGLSAQSGDGSASLKRHQPMFISSQASLTRHARTLSVKSRKAETSYQEQDAESEEEALDEEERKYLFKRSSTATRSLHWRDDGEDD